MAAPRRACPSCGSDELRHVERLDTGGGMGGGTFLALRGGHVSSLGRFEALICRRCGHTQLFLSEPADLDKLL